MIWLLALPLCYPIWALTHELSHIVAAQLTVGVRAWSIYIIPKRMPDGGWRFAGYRYMAVGPHRPWHKPVIHLAPRIPNLFAALALPAAATLPDPWRWPLAVYLGSALIDLWVGSWGGSERSDLRRAATALDISPWLLRAPGWLAMAASLIATLALWPW